MRCRRERFEQGASRVEHPARERTSFACNADRSVHAGNPEGMNLSARMAASSERAVLLDTARIEAHNIAMSALELKQGVTQELALSVFALTYIDNLRKAQAAEE